MKLFFVLLLLFAYFIHTNAQLITLGLLVCEGGPVIFRQSSTLGETFQLEPDTESSCTVGEGACARSGLGVLSAQSGIGMCSVTRDCGVGDQTCLRRILQNGDFVIEGCCKPDFEGWALLGGLTTRGDQNPAPLETVRMTGGMTGAAGVGN